MPCSSALLTLALALALALVATPVAAGPSTTVSVDKATGVYTVLVGGKAWYQSSAAPVVCVEGAQVPLAMAGSAAASGSDGFGEWTGTAVRYTSRSPAASIEIVFKQYAALPQLAVGTARFPVGLNTTGCGTNSQVATQFPAFNTSAAQAGALNTLSWRGAVIANTAAAKGLEQLGNSALDCGPVVSTDGTSAARTTLVWSTLDSHKIVPQVTDQGVYRMGLSAAIPSIPAGFNHSVMFAAADGGATAGVYAWGDLIQRFHGIKRLPSVTLSDIGYYTDDGAYYYVWGGGKERNDPQLSPWIPPRPWPAEEGLVLVKEALHSMGVPVAYMQLDDWWYQGPFYFGNVKSVVDWHASNSSGLFPHGLPAFSDKLGLPLQLYTPFWSDEFQTKYRTFESTSFKGTKLVVPDDSYHFFADFFDLGLEMTNGRFNTFEIDFLDNNFAGCADCFEDVGAADRWYRGMADAALQRNITLQFCLPSATDMLASLAYPAVVQARASADYARKNGDMAPGDNVANLGGSSLLLGATAMAPSKDTLWTASPQPATSSDRAHTGYTVQPHVQLDSILATLSLGPVGISDGLNLTDASLIGQAFRSSTDSTLLRPSRPLSTVDSVFTNRSEAAAALPTAATPPSVGKAIASGSVTDVRGTHASLGAGNGPNSHYLLTWMATQEVTLQATDLYPAPAPTARLAMRKHIVAPAGAGQLAGCADGQPAVPGCIQVFPAGAMPVLPPVADKAGNITAYGLWSVYEPTPNGAYFLGELSKFVHVSPQRFTSVHVAGDAPCGLTVRLKGTAGERVSLVAVDPKGMAHVTVAVVPPSGETSVAM